MSASDSTRAEARPVSFLSFRLDRAGGRLSRGGQAIPLRRKTWEVLLYLVDRSGVLVSKDELLDAVWPDTAVTPDVLIRSIRELRIALGDSSRKPKCIETVHRRGYRFLPEVREDSAALPQTRVAQTSAGKRLFVGREFELRRLEQLFAEARAGNRQIVFLTAAAGVGKTALVEAFVESRLGCGERVCVGRGVAVDQHGPREAFLPVLEALEDLARQPAESAFLVECLRRAAPTWLAQMPWLLGDDENRVPPPTVGGPERMLREFADFIDTFTERRPVVLVLEDLHWSDVSTVDLLSLLGQRPPRSRLLVIGTYRPAEVAVRDHALSQAVRSMQVRHQCFELPVHELFREDVQSYLEARFPDGEFAEDLAPLLHDHTDGNALLVVAVVEHMLSRGWILETDPGWELSLPLDKIDLGVPDDARRMIEMELDRLSPGDRKLLEAASVVGREFSAAIVAAALGAEVNDVEDRCEELLRTRWFLCETRGATGPEDRIPDRYAFVHELFRQAAYEGIGAPHRRRLHQRCGEALESAYADRVAEIAPVLAVHFERSRDLGRAIRYLALAAVNAKQKLATREALRYLDDALAVVPQLPESTERNRHELELRLAIAPALSDLEGIGSEAARVNADRAYGLCRQVGTREQTFAVLNVLCHIYGSRADRVQSVYVDELRELARQLGTPEHRMMVASLDVRLATMGGRFSQAREMAERDLPPLESVTSLRLPFEFAAHPLVVAHCQYAVALWMLGYPVPAREVVRSCLTSAEACGSSFYTLTAVLLFNCLLAVLSRDFEEARGFAERALSLSAKHGFVFRNSMAMALDGRVQVEDGGIHEGIEELEAARKTHRATGARSFATYIQAFLAEGYLRGGMIDRGLEAVDEGLREAEETEAHSFVAELWRIKGELLSRATTERPHRRLTENEPPGDGRAAAQCFLRALDLAREAGAKSLELRAAMSVARAWHARGRSPEARAQLREVTAWFDDRADSVDLAEARRLLAGLSEHVKQNGSRRRTRSPARRENSSRPRARDRDRVAHGKD